ncbi:MAG: hypothetical protein HYX42_16090 [Polaromonas sp.]|uniref:tetratricopeptide repeat protein n=1 Tax=Polaromonas sp. TaxID=1869339 RepID=UPI0025DE6CC1|nr:hypothetical protein [Polaromonas sp.]MBI2727762.1 hypothetical protein [Polaromonas sp.]
MGQGTPKNEIPASAGLPAWAAALCLAGFDAAAAPADDVKALLEQGKDREAYAAGKASPDSLGTPLFDFYFGIAALNAGVPGEGVLALERYLLQFPDNRSALFQLARGYFILGEDTRAREEFSALVAGASGGELTNINLFLDAIRARESRYKPTSSAFVEIGGGHDSNINSGIASGQVAGLPAGVVIAPGQSSEKRSDLFGTVAAGIQGVYPVAPGVALYGGSQVSGRIHRQGNSDVFNQSLLSLQGGVSVLQGRSLYRLGLDFTHLALGTQPYLNLTTVVGEWQYQGDQFNRYGVSLQWSDQAYKNIDTWLDINKTVKVASGADVRDSRLSNISGFWTRNFSHAWSPELMLGLNMGEEKNRKDRPDLSRGLWGIRTGITLQPIARWTLGGGLSYQNSRYERDYAPGLSPRRDEFLALDLSASYAIDRSWLLRTEYQRIAQQSTIGFFSYNRDQLALKLRYEFR